MFTTATTVVAAILTVAAVGPAVSALTSDLSLGNVQVVDVDTNAPIPDFKFIINVDNTGTTDQRDPGDGCSPETAGYPASCNWTSMGVASSSPILTQGTQDDLAAGLAGIPDGRYLISVLADGYKLDGQHFTMPLGDTAVVTVALGATAIPDATIQAAVFEDISPVNGAPDLPAEHGLAGYTGVVRDTLGEVTTDVYGSPLCGTGVCYSYCYVVDNGVDIGIVEPTDSAGRCPTLSEQLAPGDPTGLLYTTDERPGAGSAYATPVPATAAIEGKVKIPNLGTNRFTLTVNPPDGQSMIQTTTLEGNHDWDAWIMEGVTGLDTEFVVAGEPFPAIIFGYTPGALDTMDGGAGTITGVIDLMKVYVPASGGLPIGGTIWGGMNGGKLGGPIDRPYVALSDLGGGDTAVWVGRGATDGSFTIPNVPDGVYTLSWWDEPQDYILDLQQVTVANGEVVDLGVLPLTGWWTEYTGYVFNDTNRNGIMDWTDTNGDGCPQAGEGETGVPNFGLTVRRRENTLMDRGTTAVSTDACGFYYMESAYPMTQWLVLEAYNDLYYTTGITYQADNQPEPTTVIGAGVDVSTLPIIGLAGRLDWGVHSYDARGTNGVDPRNGGIVGTVSYDTTRNELDPRFAAVEDWQPGVSDVSVELYAPVECTDALVETCDVDELYQLDYDGSYLRGQLLNATTTETWQQPGRNDDGVCIPRDVDGNRLDYPSGQRITASDNDCLEGPLMGVQFQNGYSTVDGNYGFGDGCFAPNHLDLADPSAPVCLDPADTDVGFTALPGASDYIVHVGVPNDAYGKPLYQFTKEEDINIGNGDEFYPQIPPPACVGALHTVDVANSGTDSYPEVVGDGANGVPVGVTVPASTPVDNATFLDIDGSPYEGLAKPSCDTKLVPLANGKSVAPLFNVFTDVPIPGRFWGLLVDDLNFSADPTQVNFGEKAGIPLAPVGIYDYTNRLVYSTESDHSGLFDVLMPSTNRISCPTPSGMCANVFRFVGNDPGTPGHLNSNYKPSYRTIAAEFESMPGTLIPADLAPTQVGVSVQLPGAQAIAVECALPVTVPQLFAVDKPYVNGSGSFTIQGQGFGPTAGQVTLDGTVLPTTAWSNTAITATVAASVPAGPHQLLVKSSAGVTTVNGLTFHVIRAAVASPFPSTGILDNFNRANSTNLGPDWSIILGIPTTPGFSVNANQMRSTGYLGQPITVLHGPVVGSPGADQEVFATMTKFGAASSQVGLLLKGLVGSGIRVVRTPTNVQVQTSTIVSTTWVTQATLPTVVAAGSVLGARTFADGTVNVYVNGAQIGTVNVTTTANPWPAALASSPFGGRIGVYTLGALNNNTNDIRLDNFGGGTYVAPASAGTYTPNVYEVGPGKTFATVQAGIDAATASAGDDLVVVYPGQPDLTNPRVNPRGAYYENLIMTTPMKLQGVGPGGIRGTETVPGSIIDGGAFGGDGSTAAIWYDRITALTWDGNQSINDGAVVSIFTHDGVFTDAFKGAIDGFDLRGGDQGGFPGNINAIGGGGTGLPGGLVTQGGAVFANAYARHLQITNNVVQNNGGAYGTIRVGTPDINAASNSNSNVRIANNRVIANGGTNLAGGIGLFSGSDSYTITQNDICGNFSAEYGGGISAYGYSPGGTIDHNRIWFNQSYDEGGGVMIAGSLPSNPTALSQGSGPVSIHDNVIQSNLSNDDGGGIRFLMAGNFPMDVFNNMIVNNVSTHEGGGVSLNDTPNVRFFNNTVMKNVTTATALTSNGAPAPAGLSTSQNSAQLQATLVGAPSFSDPLLFDNIFWDNRAGARGADKVLGIGAAGDATPINNWDLGVADGPGLLSPTNSVLQTTIGTNPVTMGPTANKSVDPQVLSPYDTQVAFNGWRTNPNFFGAILISLDLPPELLGDYHVAATSPAVSLGAASKSGVGAAATDIDGTVRPQGGGFEAGADEIVAAPPAPFPSAGAGVLDNFNRGNSGSLGSNWSTPASGVRVNTSTLEIRSNPSTPVLWTTAFGAGQDAYFTFTDVSALASEQGLVLKSTTNSMIRVTYNHSNNTVSIVTVDGANTVNRSTITGVSFGNSDTLGARAIGGVVTVYRNNTVIGTTDVATGPSPWPGSSGGGQVGIWFVGTTNTAAGNARIDNFGGGNTP